MICDDDYTRIEAILALSGLDSPEAEEQLLSAIDDSNQLLRKAALKVLGERFDLKYLPVFVAAFDDEAEEVRKIAAAYLLGVSDWEIRNETVTLLGAIKNPEYIPFLVRALHDEYEIPDTAVNALIGLNDHQCIKPLIEIIKNSDNDPPLRKCAMKVLSVFEDADVLDTLHTVLGDEAVGFDAARTLGMYPGLEARNLLLKALVEGDSRTRLMAAAGVRYNGDARALLPLCSMLADIDPLLKSHAAYAIAGIAGNARESADQGVGNAGTDLTSAIKPLMCAMDDNDENVRKAVFEALGRINSQESFPFLLSALRDPSPWVVSATVSALGEMKCVEAIEPLLDLIANGTEVNHSIRLSVLCALGEIGNQMASKALDDLDE